MVTVYIKPLQFYEWRYVVNKSQFYLSQHQRITMYDYEMDLIHMKVVLMFAMRDNGVPSVTMAGTSMMLW